MKNFVLQSLLFTSIVLVLIIGSIYLKVTLCYSDCFEVDKSVTTLMTGDSHTQDGINDSILPEILNVSTIAESYMLSYFKIKSVVNKNPQIKNVILSFSYQNLSNFYDYFIFGPHSIELNKNFVKIMDFSQLVELTFREPKISFNILFPSNNSFAYIGGYSKGDDAEFDFTRVGKRIELQFYEQFTRLRCQRSVSANNEKYFNRIVKFCKKKGLNLVLINTPKPEPYLEKIPDFFKQAYSKTLEDTHLPMIDFQDLKLSLKCYMPDGDHLNRKGADITTKYFNNYILNSNILIKPNM